MLDGMNKQHQTFDLIFGLFLIVISFAFGFAFGGVSEHGEYLDLQDEIVERGFAKYVVDPDNRHNTQFVWLTPDTEKEN
jgi:hypothetical protein